MSGKHTMENRQKGRETTGKLQHSRPTIGLLADRLGWEAISDSFWRGISDMVREQGANLISFIGGSVYGTSYPSEAQRNVLYELVNIDDLDGLLILSGLVGAALPEAELKAFCERYRPLPMGSISQAVPGIPSVVLDDYRGMYSVVSHLIEVHGCRRIAFVLGFEGNPVTETRRRAYMDALTEHDLLIDPALLIPGNYDREHAVKAVHALLEGGQLRADAAVTLDDYLSRFMIELLRERGIDVPGEIAITGFDNVDLAACITPPLTTVSSMMYEQGRKATELLFAQLAGQAVPLETIVPTELVVRQSCGCPAPVMTQAVAGPLTAGQETLDTVLATHYEDIIAAMTQAVGKPGAGLASGWAEQLVDSFVAEIAGRPPSLFLRELDEVLRQAGAAGGDPSTFLPAGIARQSVEAWQDGLLGLRRCLLPHLEGEAFARADNLWHRAWVMIGQAAERVRAYQTLQTEQQATILREVGHALITTFDVERLMDALAEGLPRLGIPSCYLALYENPQPYEYPQPAPTGSRLRLAYNEQGRVELELGGRRFPSQQLLPEGMWPQGRQFSFVVEPLYFREDQIGFVLFEAGPREASAYEALRAEISSALKGALLLQERTQAEEGIKRRSAQLETAAEVARAASSILDPDELIQRAVNLIRERFDLYYAGFFLVDETGEWTGEVGKWAVLRAGTGEAGRQMLERKHKLEIGGTSMIGWCVANQRARIALDVGQEAVRFENPCLPETRSELALPLVSRGQVIGALTIQSAKQAAFSDEDITVLQTMADQLANAIQNARLFEQAHVRAEELAVLNEVSRSLAARLSVKEVLADVYQAASHLLDATNFYVALYNADRDEVTFPFDTTEVEGDKFHTLPADQGLTGYIIRNRTSVLISENLPERLAEMGIELIGKPALSWLGVPVMLGGQVLGVMSVQSYTTSRTYDEHDREVLTAFASQMAIALQNARLFEEAQSRARHERIIREISDQMQRATDMEALMRITAEELNRALGGSRVYVRLHPEVQRPLDGDGRREGDNADEG